MIVFESDDIKFESFIFQDVDELSNVVAKSFTNYVQLQRLQVLFRNIF